MVAISIHSPDGRWIASNSTKADGLVLRRDAAGRGSATIEFPNIPLLKGEYFIGAYLLSEDGIHIYDGATNVATLHFVRTIWNRAWCRCCMHGVVMQGQVCQQAA